MALCRWCPRLWGWGSGSIVGGCGCSFGLARYQEAAFCPALSTPSEDPMPIQLSRGSLTSRWHRSERCPTTFSKPQISLAHKYDKYNFNKHISSTKSMVTWWNTTNEAHLLLLVVRETDVHHTSELRQVSVLRSGELVRIAFGDPLRNTTFLY